jgi:sporulation protein YlmC with PRC-barrel domain
LDLVRDVLDNQLVDRNGTHMGKVDGLVLVVRKDAPPQLQCIEIGVVTLARRLGPGVGRWVTRLARKLRGERLDEPYRVPWNKVRDIGVDVDLDVDIRETPASDRNTGCAASSPSAVRAADVMEVHLQLLLGKHILTEDGRPIGRLEEIRARRGARRPS